MATSSVLVLPFPKELVTNLGHEVINKRLEDKTNDQFPVGSVVNVHTCSHSAIRMPAEEEMRPKSRTAFSLSPNGSKLIKQSHGGPSSSSSRTKPTFLSVRSSGLASHLIEATSVNQGPQHKKKIPLAYCTPTITENERGKEHNNYKRNPIWKNKVPSVHLRPSPLIYPQVFTCHNVTSSSPGPQIRPY